MCKKAKTTTCEYKENGCCIKEDCPVAGTHNTIELVKLGTDKKVPAISGNK